MNNSLLRGGFFAVCAAALSIRIAGAAPVHADGAPVHSAAFTIEQILSAPFPSDLVASSPISAVSTWRSPVLLIHGDDDRNVAFAETMRLVEALNRQGVDYQDLIFPDEIHGFLRHQSWVRAYHATADFLDAKLSAH